MVARCTAIQRCMDENEDGNDDDGARRYTTGRKKVTFVRCTSPGVCCHRTWRVATSHCARGERGAAAPPNSSRQPPFVNHAPYLLILSFASSARPPAPAARPPPTFPYSLHPTGVWCLRLQSHDGPCAASLLYVPADGDSLT